jgi:hypothetical protein
VTTQTTSKDLSSIIKKATGNDLSLHQANRVKRALIGASKTAFEISFLRIPSYIEELMAQNPGCIAEYSRFNGTGHIERVFICPAISNRTFEHSIKFLTLNATHFETGLKSMALLACGRDSHGQLIIYAWAIVEGETKESWDWFCRRLARAMPSLEGDTSSSKWMVLI